MYIQPQQAGDSECIDSAQEKVQGLQDEFTFVPISEYGSWRQLELQGRSETLQNSEKEGAQDQVGLHENTEKLVLEYCKDGFL